MKVTLTEELKEYMLEKGRRNIIVEARLCTS